MNQTTLDLKQKKYLIVGQKKSVINSFKVGKSNNPIKHC